MFSFLKHSLLSPDLVAALVEEEGGQLVALVVLLLQLLARQRHLSTKDGGDGRQGHGRENKTRPQIFEG